MEQIFKHYIGTKTVKAMPMSAHEAKENGAQLTEKTLQRNLGVDGYLVEYPDGYRSWSPKSAFNEAYKPADTYIDRMKIELNDLTEKISKAMKAFLSVDINIDACEKENLRKQIDAMVEYGEILAKRLKNAIYRESIDDGNNIGCNPPMMGVDPKQKSN